MTNEEKKIAYEFTKEAIVYGRINTILISKDELSKDNRVRFIDDVCFVFDGNIVESDYTNEDILDDFLDCFEEVFGRRLKKWYPSLKSTSPCVRIQCGDKIIGKLFREYAGGRMLGSGNLRIPDFIMYGNESIKYNYLSASIDSDGMISPQQISILSACKKYCEQLVLILQSLDYHPTMKLKDKFIRFMYGSCQTQLATVSLCFHTMALIT